MQPGSPDHEWREDCAPRRVLEIFSTKWTSMVLHALDARLGGCARTGVLHRSLPGISKKMLTQTLREMEASGLVSRRVHGTVPPAVDYSITPLGLRFVEPIELLYDWARRNPDALDMLRPRSGPKQPSPSDTESAAHAPEPKIANEEI
ncbi:winged helix-turn-helix transcriptional regulator [Sphingomonas abietis]|uniref:Helix-turn-helix domain-containing protein n=1 Tax=Sphingomonas abietis TaxID=3012344 RepID=A0ABY7NJZ0_9SPHN|nr:helix-turn-helix domain-containing protein [Sphingomonas abietis]WBO21275.1 helix-turn-helix domain-containing protein [Sphingomonas abietis]